jgi:class 3 adenylate cyclase
MLGIRYPEFYYRWEWQLRGSPVALWPLITDTNRFNHDTGLPTVEQLPPEDGGRHTARRRLRFFRLGIPIEWEEEPFEWVHPYRFGVMRRYRSGPVATMRVLTELTPLAAGGTRLVYRVWARPKNLLGLVAIPIQIGILSGRSFAAAFHRYDRTILSGGSGLDLPATRAHFAPGGRARLSSLRQRLLDQGAPADLLAHLLDVVENADDVTVARLRPYALADDWGAPRREVLELCLLATRAGLLDFQWDLLCPLCRVARATAPSLGEVQSQVHCDTCNIDFTVNFDRSVELTFRPNPAVRPVESQAYCLGGPQVTPHVAVQQLLPPGGQRSLAPLLEAGRYRLRTLALPGGQFLAVAADGQAEARLRASPEGWPGDELSLAAQPSLHFENATDHEQLFILERMAWSDQAATAAEVTALQHFRDLFANEALRPGERISVGSLTVVFTDLRESTRLYRQVGDAPAFGLVMDHFDVLQGAINAEQGAIVKTIGDAVMAVFRRPAAALRAMLNAQQALASPGDGGQPLRLKAGIHHGACIAVTLNGRLDYFGSTVNIAARLESLSSGQDIVISASVHADPEVADWLARPGSGLAAEPFQTTLRGFDQDYFELWRISRLQAPIQDLPIPPQSAQPHQS